MSILAFFAEVKSEIQKITWPGMDEFIGHMIVVMVMVAFSSVVLGFMDWAFSSALKWLFT